ncbi:MAG: hypothetical protein ACSHW1_03610 [Yoonia sp.]|uniref:hypothetical protein n=1 Tax=Yoonia sp. TaxID=2212373 RepID=UPI003EF9F33C
MVIAIFRHAARMIFNNLGQAARVSLGPLVLLAAVLLALARVLGGIFGQTGFATLMTVFGGILIAFVFSRIAVSWHRFVLLEEYSGA